MASPHQCGQTAESDQRQNGGFRNNVAEEVILYGETRVAGSTLSSSIKDAIVSFRSVLC